MTMHISVFQKSGFSICYQLWQLLFGLNFLFLVAPLLVGFFVFLQYICVWGVQIVMTECPANTIISFNSSNNLHVKSK